MLDLFAEAAALTTLVFQRFNNKILCPKTSQDGIEVLEPFPELVELTERFIMEDSVLILIKWPYSIQDAPEGVHRFQNLIMRW